MTTDGLDLTREQIAGMAPYLALGDWIAHLSPTQIAANEARHIALSIHGCAIPRRQGGGSEVGVGPGLIRFDWLHLHPMHLDGWPGRVVLGPALQVGILRDDWARRLDRWLPQIHGCNVRFRDRMGLGDV